MRIEFDRDKRDKTLMNGNRHVTPAAWSDPDDAPELTDEFFERAEEHRGAKQIGRGRPPSESPKVSVTVRYDADIVAAFKATGRGWQTRLNAALRDWLKDHVP